ncbi:MAG: hypothetical protein HY671_09720 [Chloroflexi bacterium]|nr:hypothetical protein [Chloroflexota bacterium]
MKVRVRRLLYVPIIHDRSDLGSFGAAMDRRSALLWGKKQWDRHGETMFRFWASVTDYLSSVDVSSLRIYQDGLAADGELGLRIVEEAVRRGSMNHQLILRLLSQGAELRKTEETSLLIQELKLARHGTASDASLSLHKARLTEERDRFIAGSIAETLQSSEIGALFIGAYHDVLRYLPSDIAVEQVKDLGKVRAYFEELTSGKAGKRFELLAKYLVSPVNGKRHTSLAI